MTEDFDIYPIYNHNLRNISTIYIYIYITRVASNEIYRGADNSLARTRSKQATATEDFDIHISYL